MTDSERWKERRNQVERYRVMQQETTDPLAARLLHDIVLDLEAQLEQSPQSVSLDAAFGAIAARSRAGCTTSSIEVREFGLEGCGCG